VGRIRVLTTHASQVPGAATALVPVQYVTFGGARGALRL